IAGKFSSPNSNSKLLSRIDGSLSACAVTSTGLRAAANGTQSSTCFWESSASGVSSSPSSSAASAIKTPAPPDIVMTARRPDIGLVAGAHPHPDLDAAAGRQGQEVRPERARLRDHAERPPRGWPLLEEGAESRGVPTAHVEQAETVGAAQPDAAVARDLSDAF